ncbi:MAG TPA: hypothetical protein VFH47_09245 [Candidatus Thermoplasmatota archaeon]|nr:hypothetical protein [Candidatus Thermoplasmatota archaeon]
MADEPLSGEDAPVKDVSAEVAAAAAAEVAAQEAVSEPVDVRELEELHEVTREAQGFTGIGQAEDEAVVEAAERLVEAAGDDEPTGR